MSDFTLILLVNGRENFTKRWLEYMSLVNFKHKIVIGNGNKKRLFIKKKLITQDIQNLKSSTIVIIIKIIKIIIL